MMAFLNQVKHISLLASISATVNRQRSDTSSWWRKPLRLTQDTYRRERCTVGADTRAREITRAQNMVRCEFGGDLISCAREAQSFVMRRWKGLLGLASLSG